MDILRPLFYFEFAVVVVCCFGGGGVFVKCFLPQCFWVCMLAWCYWTLIHLDVLGVVLVCGLGVVPRDLRFSVQCWLFSGLCFLSLFVL